MQEALKVIIDIQDLDMKMIRLMRLKNERQKELGQIESLRKELRTQCEDKESEVKDLNLEISQKELKLQEIVDRIKKYETQQSSVKKADEFNALTLETTAAEREKVALEQEISDVVDKKVAEEELLDTIKASLASSGKSSSTLEQEINASIGTINEEGSRLHKERSALAAKAEPELLKTYERLLKNKKDRVVVPIENRACSGCHIVLTAQHENLVRKGDNLVFCEHCSRIHYWQSEAAAEGAEAAPGRKRRRRKLASA